MTAESRQRLSPCWCVSRLFEVSEALGVDGGIGDHRSPELADKSERDLVAGAFPQECPSAFAGGDVGDVTEGQAFRR
jgi:hypothetical protein